MKAIRGGFGFRAWMCAGVLALSGCGGAAEDAVATRRIDPGLPPDPATYAGDIAFRIAEVFRTRGGDIPFVLFLGLAPDTETRLGANALVDLRELQLALPDVLTGRLDPSCGLGLDIDFGGAEAEGNAIRTRATVVATLYRCRGRGTEQERRGGRLLAQTIDVDATVNGSHEGDCVAFRLVDLSLAPRGLIGGIATFFGVTERARVAIHEQARATLAKNPVCPKLPEALALLDPDLSTVELREIGNGGIGAALSGSLELSAEKLVSLLALVEARNREPGATAGPAAGRSGQTNFRIDDVIAVRGRDFAYGLDIGLSAVAPTRIGIETTLDLRDLQRGLPDILAGYVLVDTCGGRITLQRLALEAEETSIDAKGRLGLDVFACERTAPGTWERGALLNAETVDVRARVSAEIVEGCVVFRLLQLERDPPGVLAELETGSGRVTAARAMLLEAVGILLEESPLCPELPPDVAVLDPVFDRGALHEIGDGGAGVVLDGSIDVSPTTIIALLRLLQARGAVPPAP